MRIRPVFGSGHVATFGVLSVGVGTAVGAPPLEFDFEQLDSTFQSSTSLLTISAEDQPGYPSHGYMRRNVGSSGLLNFAPGFVSESNPADFRLSLFITQLTPTTSSAVGPLTITDVDGDTFRAEINGLFVHAGGLSTLIARMSNLTFQSDEGYFDGPDGGLIPTNFPAGSLDLGMLRLSFNPGPRSFDGDFDDAETGLVGVVPAPSGAAVLALAGLAVARRRRL